MQHDSFIQGIATILWGLAWADHADEHGCAETCGCEITEIMPTIPDVIWYAAERLAGRIEGSTGFTWPVLFAAAMRADDIDEPDYTGAAALRFGECCAYMALGHGVSWFDDYPMFNTPGGEVFELHGIETSDVEQACRDHVDEVCEF